MLVSLMFVPFQTMGQERGFSIDLPKAFPSLRKDIGTSRKIPLSRNQVEIDRKMWRKRRTRQLSLLTRSKPKLGKN